MVGRAEDRGSPRPITCAGRTGSGCRAGPTGQRRRRPHRRSALGPEQPAQLRTGAGDSPVIPVDRHDVRGEYRIDWARNASSRAANVLLEPDPMCEGPAGGDGDGLRIGVGQRRRRSVPARSRCRCRARGVRLRPAIPAGSAPGVLTWPAPDQSPAGGKGGLQPSAGRLPVGREFRCSSASPVAASTTREPRGRVRRAVVADLAVAHRPAGVDHPVPVPPGGTRG